MGQMNLATIQSVNETTEISDIEQLNIMQESEAEMLIDNYKFNEKDIDQNTDKVAIIVTVTKTNIKDIQELKTKTSCKTKKK